MRRLVFLGLAGLMLLPAARAGDDQEKKDGKEDAFKIEGKLTKDDPADTILKRSPHKVHDFKMKAGAIYVIDMVSKDPKLLDAYLRLEDSSGKNLAMDDDSGGFPNARILFKAPKDDTYRIIATAYSGDGDYTLKVKEVSPKDLRGELGLAFCESLRLQYETRHQDGDRGAGNLLVEAETLLKEIAADRTELVPRIHEAQFALKHLTAGRTAMEIEAEDLDGKTFKLSDYRGKVVVLDFWGHW